jgi:hypothetical protein
MGLDFDTPEFLEWKPDDPFDCDVWATASIGDERSSVLFQIHICTAASIERIEKKRHCFVIEQFTGMADLIAHLDAFIAEKLRGCTGDPYRILARLWIYEYGKYDDRGNLVG